MNIADNQQHIQKVLEALLPQIGKEIATKYQQDTLEQRTLSYKTQQEKLEQQALLQYQELSKVIRGEHQKAIQKQKIQFQKQMQQRSFLGSTRQKIDQIKYQRFKDSIKLSNIEQLIIKSDQMNILQKEIQEEIQEKYKSKFQQQLVTCHNQLFYKSGIRLTKQLITGKKEIDTKIDQMTVNLKKEVQTQKTSLATLRSKSNILIKKLNTQKQQILKKCQSQTTQKQQLYEQLLIRYKQLQKEAIESAGVLIRNSFEQPNQKPTGSNLLFELISEHSSEKSMSSHDAGQLSESVQQTHFQSYKMPYSRILDMDIKKYTSVQTQSQNKSLNQLSSYIPPSTRRQQTSFQIQYKRQLQKMNNKNKLSALAKSIIVETIVKKGKQNNFKFVNIR